MLIHTSKIKNSLSVGHNCLNSILENDIWIWIKRSENPYVIYFKRYYKYGLIYLCLQITKSLLTILCALLPWLFCIPIVLTSHHLAHWIVATSLALLECRTRHRKNAASAFHQAVRCSDPHAMCYDHEWWSCSDCKLLSNNDPQTLIKRASLFNIYRLLIDSHCLHCRLGYIEWDQEYWAQTEPECLTEVPGTVKAEWSCSSNHLWH